MKAKKLFSPELPLKSEPKIPYYLSLLVALLAGAASLAGLLYADALYPQPDLFLSYLPSDVANLVVGLPFLLASLWAARGGRLAGLLVWPGALFFMLYSYALYLLALPFGAMFLVYLLLVTLSAYTLIALLVHIDYPALGQRFGGNVPARPAAGVLLFLALLIMLRVVGLSMQALSAGAPVDQAELALWITDFLIGGAAMLVCGVMLWQRKPFGYASAPGLLLQYALLAVSLVPVIIIQANLSGEPVDVAGVVIVLVMALICLLPFVGIVRGLREAV